MLLQVISTPNIHCHYHAPLNRKILKTFEVGNSQQCNRLQFEIIMVHFARLECEGDLLYACDASTVMATQG